MTVLDANILLYAYNADAPQHRAAAAWLEELLEGSGIIGLSWATLWAFLRISTNGRVWPNPMSPRDAFAVVRRLLMQPDVVVLHPGPRHLELLETLVTETGAIGPLVSDAALALSPSNTERSSRLRTTISAAFPPCAGSIRFPVRFEPRDLVHSRAVISGEAHGTVVDVNMRGALLIGHS